MAETFSLDDEIGDSGDGEDFIDMLKDSDAIEPEEAAQTAILREDVRGALDELTDREREVVNLRYGLHGGKAHTLQELGAHFKVSRERVRQIEGQALRKLRKSNLQEAMFEVEEEEEKKEDEEGEDKAKDGAEAEADKDSKVKGKSKSKKKIKAKNADEAESAARATEEPKVKTDSARKSKEKPKVTSGSKAKIKPKTVEKRKEKVA
jgi:hypothetical protein